MGELNRHGVPRLGVLGLLLLVCSCLLLAPQAAVADSTAALEIGNLQWQLLSYSSTYNIGAGNYMGTMDYGYYARYPNGYPGTAAQELLDSFGGAQFVRDIADDSGGMYAYTLFVQLGGDPNVVTFGIGKYLIQVGAQFPSYAHVTSWNLSHEVTLHVTGTTVVGVYDGSDVNNVVALPNATVNFYARASTAAFGTSAHTLLHPSTIAGKQVAYCTFGHVDGGGGSRIDAEYPPGKASGDFVFTVSCPGYQTAVETGTQANAGTIKSGLAWAGSGCIVVLYKTGDSRVPTFNPPSTEFPAPTAGGTSTVDPSIPATGGGGGGSAGGAWYDNFWDAFQTAMVTLFTPDQTDMDSLKAAWSNLYGTGPFGIYADMNNWWAQANALAYNYDSTQQAYWQISFSHLLSQTDFLPADSVIGLPAGYDFTNSWANTHAPDVSPVLIMQQPFGSFIDLNNYAPSILRFRAMELLAVWIAGFFYFFKLIRPVVRL